MKVCTDSHCPQGINPNVFGPLTFPLALLAGRCMWFSGVDVSTAVGWTTIQFFTELWSSLDSLSHTIIRSNNE